MNKLLLSLCIIVISLKSFGQAGALDLSFNTGTGPDSTIYTISVQSDGKIIIGGLFQNYNGSPASRVARLNTDGSLDTSFHTFPGVSNGFVDCSTIQTDGKILIAGAFSNYDNIQTINIARLNTDGSLDTTFKPGSTVADNFVRAIALQTDGKIVVGGDFSSHLTRLNPNGTVDGTFVSGGPQGGGVNAIAIQTDNKIVIGGGFNNYNNAFPFRQRIARIDANGNLDAGFLQGADKTVEAILIQPSDNKILLSGQFTLLSSARNQIARLNTDGNVDGNFNSGTGTVTGIHSIALQSDGKIIAGGGFSAYNGTPRNAIVRINSNGSIDPIFDPGQGSDGVIFSTAIQSDGRILIAGAFTRYDGTSRNYIARLYGCNTPQPAPISGNTITGCPGYISDYSIVPVSGADKYIWTLPAGWTGNSDSTSITTTSDKGGTITVRAFSNTCGFSDTTTLTVNNYFVPDVPICLVTVDTTSTHNIIYWDKPVTGAIDSFYIYRLTSSTNSYTKIGSQPYSALSEYHDLDTAANPNSTSFRYRITVVDSCKQESDTNSCLYHNTIHLQSLGGGKLQWTLYEIESTPNPVINYKIYRDTVPYGNWHLIASTPGINTTYTDGNFNTVPGAYYRVESEWNISCNPTIINRPGDRVHQAIVNTTRSNKRDTSNSITSDTTVIIREWSMGNFEMFPNPTKGSVVLDFKQPTLLSGLQIVNSLGQIETIVLKQESVWQREIDISDLKPGMYIVVAEIAAATVRKKLVIE